jgi:predicted TPR repeat methyltransferase
VLQEGGLFALTVETHAGDGVILGAGLRYQHGAGYLHDSLIAAGLKPLAISKASTRDESGEPVPGQVAVAVRRGHQRRER